MPALVQSNDDEDWELDLTTATKSDLLVSSRHTSPKSSVSHVSIPIDLPEVSLHNSPVPMVADLSVVPQSNLSSSLHTTSSDYIIDDLKKPDPKRKSEVVVNEDALEKEVQDALDGYDVQQEVRASIGSIAMENQFIGSIKLTRTRSWLFSKIPSFSKFKIPKEPNTRSLKLFDTYKFADKLDIILMIIGTMAAIAVGVCYPVMFYFYRQVLNIFVDYNNLHTNSTVNSTVNSSNLCLSTANTTNLLSLSEAIKPLLHFYILLGSLSIFFSWIAWTCWIIAAERQVRRIRYKLFRSILRQEIGWFDVHNAGELSNRLINDLDKIKDGMGEKVPDFIALSARMIAALIYSLVTGWKLTLVYLAMSPFIILGLNLNIKMIVKYTVKEVKSFAAASSVAQEVLQNIRTTTAFHGQEKEEKRFAKNLIESKAIGIKKAIYVGLCQCFSSIVNYSSFAVIVWYGPYLVRTDCSNYSTGSVFVIFFGSMTATICIAQFIPNIQNFAESAASGIHVFDIIERQTEIDASSDEGDKPEDITGHIELKNITFTYPARPEASVLNKVSLEIPSGKTVALVGPSGCGKSTIIQLIQRFYDPDDGEVLLDGKDIKSLNVTWLRSRIGIVSQEPILFTGSIEENIRFGKQNATDEEVQNAAKMANAHDFIMGLPQAYKTTSGDKLSGGQKQRVAIARALISNPKILLLDEATSALDNTSERIVQDALDKAKEGRTTIVIAHRLSTIRNVDIIIGLEHGEVREYGSHDELMEYKGLYYELVIAQTEKEIDEDSDNEDEENEDVIQELLAPPPPIPVLRRFSRMSIFSLGNSDGFNEDSDEISPDDLSHNKGFFHRPFIYKILKLNAPEWRWILLGTIASIVYGGATPLYGLVSANVYGTFGASDVHEQEHLTRNYSIISFSLGLGLGIAQFLTSLSFGKSGEALTMRLRKLTFSSMLRQEMAYFDNESNTTGALVTRLSTDASALKGLTGVRIGIILQSISAVIVGLVIGFIESWKLTIVVLCFSPVMLLTYKMRARDQVPTGPKAKESFVEQAGQHAIQAIEHIRTVVSLHQENHFIDLYENAFDQDFRKQTCYAHLTALSSAITNSSFYFLHAACFGYGARLLENGEVRFVQIYQVFSVVVMAIYAVGHAMAIIPDYSKAKKAALRIMKLHKRESQIDPTDESGIILDDVMGNIEFCDVDFRYPCRSTLRVLRHFSLKCPNGQTTALVGPSGGGKSTTIALLQRFYDPNRGKILLDGNDIKVLNIRWLRSLLGLVQQEPVLFNLSIGENIAYGDNSREIRQAEIETAARMANIHDLIISLPQGYDTSCGAKGSQLSGGQKQRIAIARALIRNPKILLLDEATSALDNKSEKVVQAAIDEARAGRTCLTIAHRLSTIRNSEKIAVVSRGKMTEEGTHEELLRQNGTYAKLTLAQERTAHS